MRIVLLAATVLTLASGCTWVHMAPGADTVRVIGAGGPPPGCERRGEIEVSVKDRLAFFERNELRVREELETLARNEAPGVQADTIQPVAPPHNGDQRFIAWRCSGRAGAAPAATPMPGTAQTYPVGG